jgi:mono/diheme cytochrome c family protein
MKKIVVFVALVTAAGILFWQGDLMANGYKHGHRVYETRCEICHGVDGNGKGPAAASFTPRPTSFRDGKFWQRRDVAQVITKAIQEGYGAMPAIDLEPYEIQDVIDYLSHAFKPHGM